MADTSSLFDPQMALSLMAPGLVGGNGQIDLEGYRQQRMYQSLMGLAAGLLSQSGPSLQPTGFAPALGAGLQGMLGAQQGYDKQALQGAQAAHLFADINKLSAEEATLRGHEAAANRVGQMAPFLFDNSGGFAPASTPDAAPASSTSTGVASPGGLGRQAMGMATPASSAVTIGGPDQVDNWEVRNNNFGGLRKPGVIAGPNAGGFQGFSTPEEGVTAISKQLDRYASGATTGRPLTTINDIVSTWAPPHENPTATLIARASQVIGVSPHQPLNLSDPTVKAKLIEATIRNEQGGKLPVDPAIINKVAGLSDHQQDGGTPSVQAPSVQASSPSIQAQSLPPVVQMPNGDRRIRPDIAQAMTFEMERAGLKIPTWLNKAAEGPLERQMELYKANVDMMKAGPIAGAQAKAQYPYQAALKTLEADNDLTNKLAAAGVRFENGKIVPIEGFNAASAATKGSEAGAVAEAQLPSNLLQKKAEADLTRRNQQDQARFNVDPNAFGGGTQAQGYGPGLTEPLRTDRGTVIPPITAASPIVGSPDYLKDRQTGKGGWAETEGKLASAVQVNAEDEGRVLALAKVFQTYGTGSFASALSDLRAKARAVGVEIPEDIAGDPAKAQIAAKLAFQRMIGSMRGIDSNPTGWQLKAMVENWISTDTQPETNHEVVARTLGVMRQTNALARDWSEAKKYGWRDPQDFQTTWLAAPENNLSNFVDSAGKEIGTFKGMPKPLDEATATQARDAISKGAPRDAVIQRLRQGGFSPDGL